MKEARYFYVPNLEMQGQLPTDEVMHAVRVLHLQVGDTIWVTDGEGQCYEAEVSEVGKRHCAYRCVSPIASPRMWQGQLHLAMAPTKNIDRTEWMIEKTTEIGIDRVSFLRCQYSERKQVRIDRMEKIAVSAMKQSHKAFLPRLDDLVDFQAFVAQPYKGQKFIAHCYLPEDVGEYEKPHLFDLLDISQDVLVLIGPEGDFSVDEVRAALAAGYISVSLGKSRLRTETAALMAVQLMQLTHRK